MVATKNIKKLGEWFYVQNFFGYVAQLVSYFSLLASNLLLPIVLGPYLFGLLSLTTAIASIAIAVFHEGFSLQAMQATQLTRNNPRFTSGLLKRICWSAIAFALISSIFITFLVPTLGRSLNLRIEDIYILYWAGPLAFLLTLNLLFINLLTASLQLKLVALATLISGSMLVVFPLSVYFMTYSSFWTVGTLVFAYLISVTFLFRFVINKFPGLFSFYPVSGPRWGDVLRPVALYASGNAFTTVLNSGLLILVAAFHSVEEAAYFKIALSFTLSLVALIPTPKYTIFASLLHLYEPSYSISEGGPEERVQLESYLRLLSKYAAAVMVLLLAGAWVLGPAAVSWFYGSQFTQAASYIRWFSLSLLFYFGLNILVPLCWAQDKLRQIAIGYAVAGAITLVSGWILARAGGVGIVWSYLIGLVIMLVFTLSYVSPTVRITILRALAKPSITLPFVVLISLIVQPSPSLQELVTTGLGLVGVYIVILFLLRWFDWNEISILFGLHPHEQEIRLP